MQKIKVVQIGSRSFTLKELPVREVWGLLNDGQSAKNINMLDRCKNLLSKACPELTEDVLLDLYPSEVKDLWQGFEEVNDVFLGVVRQTGLVEIMIDSFRPILAAEFGKALLISTGASATSLQPAMDQEYGTTDTVSS